MGRTEFEWDGSDHPSIWDDFVPLEGAPGVRVHRSKQDWRISLDPTGNRATVITPWGDVVSNIEVENPYATSPWDEIVGEGTEGEEDIEALSVVEGPPEDRPYDHDVIFWDYGPEVMIGDKPERHRLDSFTVSIRSP